MCIHWVLRSASTENHLQGNEWQMSGHLPCLRQCAAIISWPVLTLVTYHGENMRPSTYTNLTVFVSNQKLHPLSHNLCLILLVICWLDLSWPDLTRLSAFVKVAVSGSQSPDAICLTRLPPDYLTAPVRIIAGSNEKLPSQSLTGRQAHSIGAVSSLVLPTKPQKPAPPRDAPLQSHEPGTQQKVEKKWLT